MSDKTCNVFIIHNHDDDLRLQPLKDLLKSRGHEARDGSEASETLRGAEEPGEMMSGVLKPGIDWADTLVVLVTHETKDASWVNDQVEYAHEQGKNIVGVWPEGETGCELAEALQHVADHMVPPNGDRIMEAILDILDGWLDPCGKPIEPRSIPRYKC